MKVTRYIYVKGKIKGSYQGDLDYTSGSKTYYEIDLLRKKVFGFEKVPEYNFKRMCAGKHLSFQKLKEVLVSDGSEKGYYEEDFTEVVIRDIKIDEYFPSSDSPYVKFTGTFYGTLSYVEEVPDKKPVKKVAVVKEVKKKPIVSAVTTPKPKPRKRIRIIEKADNLTKKAERIAPELIKETTGNSSPVKGCVTLFIFGVLLAILFSYNWILGLVVLLVGGGLIFSGLKSNSPTPKSGCFSSIFRFLIILVLVCLFIFLITYVKGGYVWLVVLVGVGLLFAFSRSVWSFLGTLTYLLIGLIMLALAIGFIYNLIETDNWETEDTEETYDPEEDRTVYEDTLTSDGKIIAHSHNWVNYDKMDYNEIFKIGANDAAKAKGFRNNLNLSYYDNALWTKLYSKLVMHDKESIDKIVNMFGDLAKERNIKKKELAEIIVSSIQYIPYVLVHEESCLKARKMGGFMTDYHRSGKPCLPNILYGIQSPAEFMSDFQGDCDTRAVLAYAVLTKLGYNAAVLVSEKYGHAILGLNLPSAGKYVKYKSVKYYTWETTARTWQLGQLPPTCSNIRYWRVALPGNIF